MIWSRQWPGHLFMLAVVGLVVVFLRGERTRGSEPTSGPELVPVTLPSGKVLRVELARTWQEREQGLMFRESLAADSGMLFVAEKAEPLSIWMKNCRMPLDIVYLDIDKRVVDVVSWAPPCVGDPCPVFTSPLPASYVLEVNAGQALREGVREGQLVGFRLGG